MSLVTQDEVSFKQLWVHTKLSEGNLASHLRVLENRGLIKYRKTFLNRYPITYYQATTKGHKEYSKTLQWLEAFI